MEMWVFWLESGIIVFLIFFILIRDKGVREIIKKIFGWARKKIKAAKIKSKINSFLDSKNKLIPQLGEKYWQSGTNEDNTYIITNELNNINGEIQSLAKTLETTKKNIIESKSNLELNIKEKNKVIDALKNEKAPLDIELKKLEKEFNSVDKTIKEQQKLKQKIENNIKNNNKEIEKINSEPKGYSTENEKNIKIKKNEEKNKELNNEIVEIEKKIKDLRSENPTASKMIDELNAKISNINNEINNKKDEISNLKTEITKIINTLEETEKNIEKNLKEKSKKKELKLKDLGLFLLENRVDLSETTDVYTQIDNIDRIISSLNKKLEKINLKEEID